MSARAQGLNWQPIQAAYFPNKTPNACRKRHERLMDRRNSDDWDAIKLETMAKEYMGMRREIWQQLGAKTGEKWSVVEAKVSPLPSLPFPVASSPSYTQVKTSPNTHPSACNQASKTSNLPPVPAPAASASKPPEGAPAPLCCPCSITGTIYTVGTASPAVPMTAASAWTS